MDSDWSIDGDQGMSLVEKVLDLTSETGHVVMLFAMVSRPGVSLVTIAVTLRRFIGFNLCPAPALSQNEN